MSLVTEINGNPILWQGHLCEGDEMVTGDRSTFILWTRCGARDVPANTAWTGRFEDVRCSKCQDIKAAEGE